MSLERSQALQAVLDGLRLAIAASASSDHPSVAASDRIFSALDTVVESAAGAPAQPDVCRHLDQAFAVARSARPKLSSLIDALRDISGSLHWAPRAGSKTGDRAFAAGHANAVLVGRGGIEPREDVRIGMSLMAPGIRYPDHRHPPEEVYVVLSDGEWMQGEGNWFKPGIGGIVYNSPSILHAMRAPASEPLLAAWLLWEAPFRA